MMTEMMLAVVGLMMVMDLFADKWTDPETEITWTYSVEFGNARVVRAYPLEGNISIPSKLGEWNVTIIGDSAFYGCKSMISVTVPEGVTDLRGYAFTGCNSLTSVTIPGGVTSIGDYAFSGCSSLTSMTIPEGVTNIGKNAFGECSSLTSVTIPKSVMNIGDTAFRGCSQSLDFVVDVGNRDYKSENGFLLSKNGLVLSPGTNISGVVAIPPNATSIDGFAFCRRSGLKNVTIPPSVTNIGEYAFWECVGLTSVTIPAGVASIGENAYLRCDGLDAVDFEGTPPAALTEASIKRDAAIRYNVAYEDEWLPVIEDCGFTNATPYVPHALSDGGPYTEIVNGIEWTFVVTNGEASVGGGCCKRAVSISTEGVVEIPTILGGCKVTVVGDGAFANIEGITRVVIPSGVYEIGEEAFWYCKSLTGVLMPEGLTTICKNAFCGCSKLEEVVLPQSLATIWEGAFAFSALKSVVIPGGVSLVGVFDYWNGQHFGAFDSCRLQSVCFEEGVDSIECYAFRDCWELKSEITVSPPHEMAVGTFSGFVTQKSMFDADLEMTFGAIQVTTTDAGKITAKITAAAKTYSFSETSWSRITDGGYEVDMSLKSGETLTLVLNHNARWDEHQLSGRFAFKDMPTNGTYFEVSAQRNAYGKQWHFDVKGDADDGWTFAYAAEPKKAALTVSWNADGKTSVAGRLGSLKVSASGYCDVSGITEGVVMADFAPVVTVGKEKRGFVHKCGSRIAA